MTGSRETKGKNLGAGTSCGLSRNQQFSLRGIGNCASKHAVQASPGRAGRGVEPDREPDRNPDARQRRGSHALELTSW
jgi:hypothetical protein